MFSMWIFSASQIMYVLISFKSKLMLITLLKLQVKIMIKVDFKLVYKFASATTRHGVKYFSIY